MYLLCQRSVNAMLTFSSLSNLITKKWGSLLLSVFCLKIFPQYNFQGVPLSNKLSVSMKNLFLLRISLKAALEWLTPIYQDFTDKQF